MNLAQADDGTTELVGPLVDQAALLSSLTIRPPSCHPLHRLTGRCNAAWSV
jgi:hypothetical protein